MVRWPLLLFLLFLLTGCCGQTAATAGQGKNTLENNAEIREFDGTVVFVPLEGGFYGIREDQGERYDPVNLPESFRKDGLAVRVKARTLPGAVGFHMWGTRIEILDIRER